MKLSEEKKISYVNGKSQLRYFCNSYKDALAFHRFVETNST